MNIALKATFVALTLTATAGALAGWGSSTAGVAGTTAAALVAPSAVSSAAKAYSVDPVHSSIIFKIRHSGLSNFYGRFNDLAGTIEFDKDNIPATTMSFTVDIDSVDTKDRKRDSHVKSADFFNSRQYPQATFTSTSVAEDDQGGYTITGDFSIHGQTHPITATMTSVETLVQKGTPMLGFEARFSFKRSDFGMTKYIDTANPEDGPVGDKVELIISIESAAK